MCTKRRIQYPRIETYMYMYPHDFINETFCLKEAEDDLFKQQFKRFRKPNPHDLTEVIDFDQPDKFDEVYTETHPSVASYHKCVGGTYNLIHLFSNDPLY